MHHEPIDMLLAETLGGEVPNLPSDFERRVVRELRAGRLTRSARVVMSVYVIAAAAAAVWLMRDVSIVRIEQALAFGVPLAVAVSAYGRRLVAIS